MPLIRIATRSSRQASTQSGRVAEQLNAAGYATELVYVDTFGDQTQASGVPLHAIGGQGVFVKAVQQAVLDRRADIAVHSAKDLPTVAVPGLHLGAFVTRRSPHDALVGMRLDQLGQAASVATGSVRRRAQLSQARPDLEFVELRGNIDTRLARRPHGGSVVVAVAALEVLALTDHIAETLDATVFVPAVGQGCVAVEHRADDAQTARAVALLDDAATRQQVEIERSFLAELGSGCSSPVGAFCDGTVLHTFLATHSDHTRASGAVRHRLTLGADHDANLSLATQAARDSVRAIGQTDDPTTT